MSRRLICDEFVYEFLEWRRGKSAVMNEHYLLLCVCMFSISTAGCVCVCDVGCDVVHAVDSRG